jgi:3'-5' exoribonuclease
MKKQFVKDLAVGNKVNDVFYIRERRQLEKRDGSKFLILELSDKTGSISGKIWDYVDVLSSIAVPGNFVKIDGTVSEYNGEIQITVSNLHKAADKEVSSSDFLASSKHDIEKMYQELSGYIESIKDPDYKKLLDSLFSDAEFTRQFKSAPASTGIHHAYLGGLLEHTLFMLRNSKAVPNVYPEVDYSLLVAGIILHDVGKIREYLYDKVLAHTDEGYLIGHIVVGYEIVKAELDKIAGFPELKKQLILHIILSHHGQRDFGSPITPKFAEAYLVHTLDNLDARMMMFRDMTEKNSDVKWTEYHPFLETRIFVKPPPNTDKNS